MLHKGIHMTESFKPGQEVAKYLGIKPYTLYK